MVYYFLGILIICVTVTGTNVTDNEGPAENQLIDYMKEHQDEVDILTTGTGILLEDYLTVGKIGPSVVEDVQFYEDAFHFNRERIPERPSHAKGAGAFGYFVVTTDAIPRYSKASIFSKIGKKTPVCVRFSLLSEGKGAADTTRDTRGFSIKFYAEDGIWDLVGGNSPVFFIRDPAYFISFIHSQKKNPVTNLKDLDLIWDFYTLRRESIYQTMILYSDRGTPDGYRHMDGYGAHTFKLVNAQDQTVYCKFHLKTNQGVKNLTADVAKRLMMDDPDYATRDLYNAIAEKRFPSWTFYIQVMTLNEANAYQWNPFDVTKIWPEDKHPLIQVGKLVLNRNPANYFADVEQAGFSPNHMIPGIEPSPDKVLQGRLLAYIDSHNYRLGANHLQLPINRPMGVKIVNRQRDGMGVCTDNQDGSPNYLPTSFHDVVYSPNAIRPKYFVSGYVARYNTSDDDNYSQPGMFWRNELSEDDRKRLVQNMADDLQKVSSFLRVRAMKICRSVDVKFGQMLAAALNLTF